MRFEELTTFEKLSTLQSIQTLVSILVFPYLWQTIAGFMHWITTIRMKKSAALLRLIFISQTGISAYNLLRSQLLLILCLKF
jgi:hypothetical protein